MFLIVSVRKSSTMILLLRLIDWAHNRFRLRSSQVSWTYPDSIMSIFCGPVLFTICITILFSTHSICCFRCIASSCILTSIKILFLTWRVFSRILFVSSIHSSLVNISCHTVTIILMDEACRCLYCFQGCLGLENG